MKRNIAVACIGLALPLFASAGTPVEKGAHELHLRASWDLLGSQQTYMTPIRAGAGRYLTDIVQAGGFISLTKSNDDSYWGKSDVWGLGLYGEIHAPWPRSVLPYLGVSVGLLDGDTPKSTAFAASISPGLKIYLNHFVALSAQLDWNMSTDEIYDFDRDYEFKDRYPESEKVKGEGDRMGLGMSVALRVVLH